MARRATWRIPIQLNVRLIMGGKVSTGTVKNLSENGMFISADETDFDKDSECFISIPVDNETLNVPGKLVRIIRENNSHGGIGVELMDPPKKYLDFVENLLYVL